ncbi:hypothetical protein [Kaarinaea lacus]
MLFKITNLLSTVWFAALATLATGAYAEDIETLVGQPGVYTLTNLHPDENRAKLFSVNFQQAGLIPLCTEVEILEVRRKRIDFKVKDSGREYKYLHHKTAGEDVKTNAVRYFGKECNKDKVAKLSAKDQEGIAQGKALVGMSKQGVIYAIGYPPLGATPSTDASTWKYWFNRFNTFAVIFSADGIVTQVMN